VTTTKAALVMLRTPLQAVLVESILPLEHISDFLLLYYTQNDAAEDRYYFARLARRASRALYCHAPPRRFDVLGYADFLLQARRWLRDHDCDLTLLASIDNYVLNAIASRQHRSELVTFDDGMANFFRSGNYHLDRVNRRGRFYRRLLGGRNLDDLKRTIARHYTLHAGLANIVPADRLRPLAGWAGGGKGSGGELRRFFIGAPFEEVMTPPQIARFERYLRQQNCDHYVRHPRERRVLDIGAPLLDKRGRIAEEAIMEAANGCRLQLVGWFSTVLLNLSSLVEKCTVVLFAESRGTEEQAALASTVGCDVVLL
jgi:N-acetyllactosaminide alpha-2,3-sialyltransferase